ncbi:aspartate aminotransferase family protein [bacterium]|nr:aspartate aminotransferase family protein [bacterium]
MAQWKNIPIYSGASPEKVAADLKPLVNFQDQGLSLKNLHQLVEERLLPHLMRYDHPGFQSLFNAFPEEGAEWGGKIELSYNQGVTNWQVSPGGAVLEELCCQALCRLFGLSSTSDATFMYSGTYANQEALYLALHHKAEQEGFDFSKKGLPGFKNPERLAVLTSKDAHFSIKHAVRILGLGEQNLIPVEVDKNHSLDLEAFRKTLHELREKKEIFCVVLTAGTTSTGAVDPIWPAAQICRDSGTWLHVDGAYGLAYTLVPEWSSLFKGIEKADSLTWDPHKQLSIPIPNSLLFVRRKENFHRLSITSDYFNPRGSIQPNPGLKSPPSTRPFSALPLVTSLRYLGLDKLRERLRSPLQAVQKTAEKLKPMKDIEVAHQPQTGILCFRVKPEGFPESHLDSLQKHIYEIILSEGKRTISVAQLDHRRVLRLVTVSPSVTSQDLLETVDWARAIARNFNP